MFLNAPLVGACIQFRCAPIAELLGGGLHNSTVVRGTVMKSDAMGSIKLIDKAKVRTYTLSQVYSLFGWIENRGEESRESRGDESREK